MFLFSLHAVDNAGDYINKGDLVFYKGWSVNHLYKVGKIDEKETTMQLWKVNDDDDDDDLEILEHIIDYQRDRYQLRLKKNDREEKVYDSLTRFKVFNYVIYHMISVTCDYII